MLSPERWLLSLPLDIPDPQYLPCWLPTLATVPFGCRVAPMWPEPISEQCTRNEPTTTAYIQAVATVMRTRRPSGVLEKLVVGQRRPHVVSVLLGVRRWWTSVRSLSSVPSPHSTSDSARTAEPTTISLLEFNSKPNGE